MTDKNVRAQAIDLLNALGSRRVNKDWAMLNFFGMAEILDTSNDAISLARDCFDHVPSLHMCIPHTIDEYSPHAFELECVQAALLVAEGWEKGDCIEEDPKAMQDLQQFNLCSEDLEGVN